MRRRGARSTDRRRCPGCVETPSRAREWSCAEHLSVRHRERGLHDQQTGVVQADFEPRERARRRALDDVPFEVEAAAMARAGDYTLVREEPRDAAKVGTDGGERVDAVRTSDDVRLLL